MAHFRNGQKHLLCPRRALLRVIKRIKVFEPNNKFGNIVTANLPDKYTKKEKPLFEIFSFIMIFIPFGFIVGYLFYSNKFKFSSLGKMFDIISSLTYSIYNSLNSFRFIHEDIFVPTAF